MLRIRTREGQVVDVDRVELMAISRLVCVLVEDCSSTSPLELMNIEAAELGRVAEFAACYRHHPLPQCAPPLRTNDLTSLGIHPWYLQFLDMAEPTSAQRARFSRLFAAAEYLEATPLSTLCVMFMASQVVNRDATHIRLWYGIQTTNDADDDRECRIALYHNRSEDIVRRIAIDAARAIANKRKAAFAARGNK